MRVACSHRAGEAGVPPVARSREHAGKPTGGDPILAGVAEANGFDVDESPEEQAFDYARTVALSDGVFAIALTLLVLNITVPSLAAVHRGELGRQLFHRHSELSSYALSFAVIGLLWVRHHTMFRVLNRIDMRLTVLNLFYLSFVAFLPYPTRVLGLYGSEPASVALYASTGAAVATCASLIRVHASRAHLLTPWGEQMLSRRQHWAVAPAVFLISIPIAFVNTTLAQATWLLLVLHGPLTAMRRKQPPAPPAS